MRIVHSFIRASTSKRGTKIVEDESKNEVVSFDENEDKDGDDTFEQSWMCWIAEHLSQIARLASLVYACDCLVSMLQVAVLKIYYVNIYLAKIWTNIVHNYLIGCSGGSSWVQG